MPTMVCPLNKQEQIYLQHTMLKYQSRGHFAQKAFGTTRDFSINFSSHAQHTNPYISSWITQRPFAWYVCGQKQGKFTALHATSLCLICALSPQNTRHQCNIMYYTNIWQKSKSSDHDNKTIDNVTSSICATQRSSCLDRSWLGISICRCRASRNKQPHNGRKMGSTYNHWENCIKSDI